MNKFVCLNCGNQKFEEDNLIKCLCEKPRVRRILTEENLK